MTAIDHNQPSRRLLLGAGYAGGLLAIAGPGFAQTSKPATLDAIARTRGLRFGTAVAAEHLAQPDFAALIARECSVLVAENEFKWRHVEPRRDRFRFAGADAIGAFARENHMALRGHTICWSQDNRIPDWQLEMESELATNGGKAMEALLVRHAKRMAARYPAIISWDAVNEVVLPGSGQMRDSLLTRTLGDRFIDIAFAATREAAPKAQIVYNDYMSWDARPEHRNGVLRMLEAALKRGVKIDALGVQSHLGPSLGGKRDERAWRDFLQTIEGMGLAIVITELDCNDRFVKAADVATRDAEAAAVVKGYLDLTLSFASVRHVVMWGLTDRDSYLNRPGYPRDRRRPDGLPMRGHAYDEALKPKPMRTAIAAALAAAPKRG